GVASVPGGKERVVREVASADRGEAYHYIGGAESGQVERGVGKNRERSAAYAGCAAGQGCAALIRYHQGCLDIGTNCHQAEVQCRRRDGEMRRRQTCAGQLVGGIAAVACKGDRVGETARADGTETHGHQTRLSGSHVEGTAGLNCERRSGGDAAGQGQSPVVNHLIVLRVGLADYDLAEIQVGWDEGQERREIGCRDIIWATEGVRAEGTGDRQRDSVGAGADVVMAHRESRRVAGGPIAEVPMGIGEEAGGGIGESDRQRHKAGGGTAGETGCGWHGGGTGQLVGGVASVPGGKERVVREVAGADRGEAYHYIGSCEPRQVERGVG